MGVGAKLSTSCCCLLVTCFCRYVKIQNTLEGIFSCHSSSVSVFRTHHPHVMHALVPAQPPETPHAAASTVLLRDTPAGMQTLLLRRHTQMANMGGVYVFPGGKLDATDSDSSIALDQDVQTLHQTLGESALPATTAAALYVAALRETLEECGLLLAEPLHAGGMVDANHARDLLRQGQSLPKVLTTLQLRLTTRQMTPWSRWITPLVPSRATRRFDTRFFVAVAPAGQQAMHDSQETTASLWIAPRKALEHYRDGLMDLAPPQIMGLAHLARHANVHSVMQQARSQHPPTILPETFEHEGTRIICYPGDPLHSLSNAVLPGPTRLYQRGQQFVAHEGFEALFA